MINRDSENTRDLNALSGIIFSVTLLAALALYFAFYVPGIVEGVQSGAWPAKEVLWLRMHIAAYWISYALYFAGLLLAATSFFGEATTRFPWIETAMIIATALAIIGFVTGILFSKPAWNVWWVWDAKHIYALFHMIGLLGIALFVALSRLFLTGNSRNLVMTVLLFIAVVTCVGSLLIGYMRNVHPQWFPYILFQ